MDILREILQGFIAKNVRLITVSWGSMNGSKEYTRDVKKVKKEWLLAHCPELAQDLHVVKYGTDKYSLCKGLRAILVDDNKDVRQQWAFDTIDASDSTTMLEELQTLLQNTVSRETIKETPNAWGKAGYRTIPTFPKYACTKTGKVINQKTGNTLKPRKNKQGRYTVNLDGKPRALHRVIAVTWCRGDLTLEECATLEVHHKDHDASNNTASNLVFYDHNEHVEEHSHMTDYLRHMLKTDFPAYERWKNNQ